MTLVFNGNSLCWRVKYTGVGKICNYRQKSPVISETVRHKAICLPRVTNRKSYVADSSFRNHLLTAMFLTHQRNLIFLDFYVSAYSLEIANFGSKFDFWGVIRGQLMLKLNILSLIAVKYQNPSSGLISAACASDKNK